MHKTTLIGRRCEGEVDCGRWKSCCRSANNCCRRQLSLRTTASVRMLEGQRSPVDDQVERCPGTWDGFSCWDSTASGTSVRQACPAYMERVITTRECCFINWRNYHKSVLSCLCLRSRCCNGSFVFLASTAVSCRTDRQNYGPTHICRRHNSTCPPVVGLTGAGSKTRAKRETSRDGELER